MTLRPAECADYPIELWNALRATRAYITDAPGFTSQSGWQPLDKGKLIQLVDECVRAVHKKTGHWLQPGFIARVVGEDRAAQIESMANRVMETALSARHRG